MTRRRRHALAACGVTLALAAAAVAGLTLSGTDSTTAAPRGGEMPTALGVHLTQLRQAIPGNSGHAQEGPGSAEEAAFMARAYPASDIALSKIENAKSAFRKAKGRPFPSGKGKKGTWTLYGPSEALYPFTELRNATNYVPNKYIAAGRTTVLAMEPVCKPNKCRLYAAAAGGGLWRAKNATRNDPKWEFLSARVRDPGDQLDHRSTRTTTDTIWVGTGEANASGDSAAGVGIYKSTNGGDSWTGPLGASVFNSRAVGTIAVQPGNSNIVYAGSTRAVRGISSVSGGGSVGHPGRGPVGSLQVDERRAELDVRPQRLDTTSRRCRPSHRDRPDLLAARRPPRDDRSVEPDDRLCRRRTAAGSGVPPDGGHRLDADQAVAQPEAVNDDPCREFDVTTLPAARRVCTCTRATSAARTRRLFRRDDVATGDAGCSPT